MSESPEAVVQRQLEAYNAHDIEAFMATYSLSIQIIDFPSGNLITEGYDALREAYETFLKVDKPHVDIASRIVNGNLVIDQEKGSDLKRESWEVVAIYEVDNGQIQRVWFVKG
jgi:hypothetical protein